MPYKVETNIGPQKPAIPCLVIHKLNRSIKGVMTTTEKHVTIVDPGDSAFRIGQVSQTEEWEILPQGSTFTFTQE